MKKCFNGYGRNIIIMSESEQILRDRVGGVYMGQYLGDAFGTTYEFLSSKAAVGKLQKALDKSKDKFSPILGKGPFGLVPGQVTDDTELAMGLVDAILNHSDGYIAIESIGERAAWNYIMWYKSQPFDIGITTSNALRHDTPDEVVHSAYTCNQESKSNGCVMRAFSLGILGYILDDIELNSVIYNDCILTNPNPTAVDAVRVFVFAIRHLLKHGNKQSAYDEALRVCATDDIKSCLRMAVVQGDDVPCKGMFVKTDSQYQGYVGVAIQNAFYELLNGDSFAQSIINIVSRGGDTDTNACIGGALLGAYYGQSAMPSEWIKVVKECKNPRAEKYPLISHEKIDADIEGLCNIVCNYEPM